MPAALAPGHANGLANHPKARERPGRFRGPRT